MSTASLASARKRRAPISANNSNPLAPNQPNVVTQPAQNRNVAGPPLNPNALTLPQVITLVDQRLVILENHMKDNLRRQDEENVLCRDVDNIVANEMPSEILDEFNNRFETLAQELASLKDIVLNLQSYTMEVNKTLLKERIRILGGDDASIQVSSTTM